ncbi:hypothetical protein B0H17DRAFT_1061832 [Mycena rosella]|uniref:Uncharacterized protein n=1 Tax=Mycena rosella TaxID=1033263 RepID=A0AAD7DID8_MYCRO|nr:hypothetical protein B0H17DRAFT_1061832 [Mycena rosella]
MNSQNFNIPTQDGQDSAFTSASEFGTSTIGNTAGGLSKNVGNATGAAGDAIGDVGSKVQDGAEIVATAAKDADLLWMYYQARYFIRLLAPYIVGLLLVVLVFALYRSS